MPRLSIEISDTQHQQLKATAALSGKSIKDFVIERTIGGVPDLSNLREEQALDRLAEFLRDRVEHVRAGEDLVELDMDKLKADGRARKTATAG